MPGEVARGCSVGAGRHPVATSLTRRGGCRRHGRGATLEALHPDSRAGDVMTTIDQSSCVTRQVYLPRSGGADRDGRRARRSSSRPGGSAGRLLLVRRCDSGGWELPVAASTSVSPRWPPPSGRPPRNPASWLRSRSSPVSSPIPATSIRSADGEVRQQFAVLFRARVLRWRPPGRPAGDQRGRRAAPAQLRGLAIEPSARAPDRPGPEHRGPALPRVTPSWRYRAGEGLRRTESGQVPDEDPRSTIGWAKSAESSSSRSPQGRSTEPRSVRPGPATESRPQAPPDSTTTTTGAALPAWSRPPMRLPAPPGRCAGGSGRSSHQRRSSPTPAAQVQFARPPRGRTPRGREPRRAPPHSRCLAVLLWRSTWSSPARSLFSTATAVWWKSPSCRVLPHRGEVVPPRHPGRGSRRR